MHLLSVKSVEGPKVVWTGFHYLPWLAQKFEGVGGMSSLLILDVYEGSCLTGHKRINSLGRFLFVDPENSIWAFPLDNFDTFNLETVPTAKLEGEKKGMKIKSSSILTYALAIYPC